ncbi:alpha-N-acetylglucosaminidase TIM-barrel domain-containing protein [Bifidobacterium samirii]|uniref:Alpha-N-acetylglucosaminidase n=1 Tax=Bifidobacterium samirii TaxID=2306974 RepID=A0A430FUY5_9BIFI|nr:alpha-N-acetylglucosaminidase TIM-barrel domain-containing protein [Bifidobacterium samirii]RSX57378.1 alpha-N-acetylglucosaminidase [Bifidobacterium samirii]
MTPFHPTLPTWASPPALRRRAARSLTALTVALATLAGSCGLTATALAADDPAIDGVTASGASAAGHDPSAAVDGDPATYWQSPADSSMQDYRRFLDFDLGGTWDVSRIDVANPGDGAYHHYEIYLSEDGERYDKVAYKSDDAASDGTADTYRIDPTRAAYARINVSYDSAHQQVDLAEVAFHGVKISDDSPEPAPIAVEDFASSSWGAEWEKVETDPEYAEAKTIAGVRDLVSRVIGERWVDSFDFALRGQSDGKDVFEISDAGDGRILIRGNDGVSLASGLNYYLRNWCKVDYNPLFGSQLDMPDTLPAVGSKILKYTNYEYRYALNFCTYSYTMSFWAWDEYEAFLDWAAMNGVNLMLDIVGQEEVLRRTLTQYGYSDDDVREYLSGPAYYAWFYMQNLYSTGGPLPANWFPQRVELGRRIHDRMQTFGITPVIQGFGGQVPTDFQERNPDSVAASSGSWSGYDRPYMIKTYLTDDDRAAGKEDYFQKVGDTFYTEQERVFGDVSHYYAVDPFHEGGTIPDGFDIVDIYRTVQSKMLEHDPDAIWVMQQWQSGIDENKLSGLADKSQALVLDLQSDLRSQASPMENQGVPWVWNMLHNFGGRMGLDGVPEVLSQNITDAYNANSYMRGIGITPEAIDNSPIVYELLFDMTWQQDPIDYRAWTRDYAERRYGGTDTTIEQAWDILLDTAYAHTDGEYYQGASESIINARPSDNAIGSASTWGHSDIDYDKERFEQAAQLFIDAYDEYRDSEGFRYDFVDVMRQVLANAFQEYQPLAGQAYRSGDADLFAVLGEQMLGIIKAQDQLLATSDSFLLGTWIDDARTMLDDADDWTADLFELNARALVTTWGLAKNGSLIDYSNRQWAGLTGDYYYTRWATYVENRLAKLTDGTDFTDPDWFDYGWEWANRKSDETGYGFAVTASDDDRKRLAEDIMTRYTVGVMDEYTGGGSADERTNLALGRTVTDADTGENTTLPTDGSTDTGWTAQGRTDATLDIDLEGTYAITGAGITLQQIAADFPLRYEIEVWNGEKWVEIGRSEADVVSSKNDVDCDILGSKVRYRLHSTDGRQLTGIHELTIWGASQPQTTYDNIALGTTATAGSTEPGRSTSAGIDGNEGTLWVGNGSEPNWYRIDLAEPTRVDRARLVFEQAGREFRFRIVAGLEDGSERTLIDQTGNQGALDRVYTADIGERITHVTVEFTGSVGGTAWPALAELELLAESADTIEGVNIAAEATITSSPTKDAPENAGALVDGKATAWVSRDGAKPAWFQLDYPSARDVDSIRLRFEDGQPDRSMQFTLTVTDDDGTTRVVHERTADDLSEQQGITIDVPVGEAVKTIRMDITDARIPSSGGAAWPLVSEIEVYSTPRNAAGTATVTAGDGSTLDAGALAALTDGDRDSTVTLTDGADKTLTFALDRPYDIGILGILSSMKGESLRFKAEYRVPADDADADTWATLADYSGNTRLSDELLARLAAPVYTDAVRLTILNDGDVTLNETYLYVTDMAASLRSTLASVRAALSRLTFGDHAGDYRADARDTLETVLDAADQAALDTMNSRDSAAWTTRVETAVGEFYRTGYVSIDRNALYVAIDDATATRDALRGHGLTGLAATLDTPLADAKAVADAYGTVTQRDIDDAADTLGQAVADALAGVDDADTRYQIVLDTARQRLADAVIGDHEGQYPQTAADTLAAAIDTAAAARAAAADAAAIDAASAALRDAIDAFGRSVVHIDATALTAAIAAADALTERDYDSQAWAAMAAALDAARDVDLTQVPQSTVDDLAQRLAAAIDALADARLDRTVLATAIASAQALQEGDYTAASWKPFADALAAAIEARDRISTTQQALDEACGALAAARDGLERRSHGGGDEGDKPGPGEGEGGSDKPGTGEGEGGTDKPGTGEGGTDRPGAGDQKPGGTGNGSGSGKGDGSGKMSNTGSATTPVAIAALTAAALAAGLMIVRRRRGHGLR